MSKAELFDSYWTNAPSDDPRLERLSLVMAARSMIVARRALEGPLPVELIADPVVDVLMALFVAQADGRALAVAELEQAGGVAPPVARQWLSALAQAGLVEAAGDAVSLTAEGDARVTEAIRAVIRSQIGLHAGN